MIKSQLCRERGELGLANMRRAGTYCRVEMAVQRPFGNCTLGIARNYVAHLHTPAGTGRCLNRRISPGFIHTRGITLHICTKLPCKVSPQMLAALNRAQLFSLRQSTIYPRCVVRRRSQVTLASAMTTSKITLSTPILGHLPGHINRKVRSGMRSSGIQQTVINSTQFLNPGNEPTPHVERGASTYSDIPSVRQISVPHTRYNKYCFPESH